MHKPNIQTCYDDWTLCIEINIHNLFKWKINKFLTKCLQTAALQYIIQVNLGSKRKGLKYTKKEIYMYPRQCIHSLTVNLQDIFLKHKIWPLNKAMNFTKFSNIHWSNVLSTIHAFRHLINKSKNFNPQFKKIFVILFFDVCLHYLS